METLASFGLLVVVSIPIFLAVGGLMHAGQTRSETLTAFYSNPSTFPSLAAMQELEETSPSFVKRQDWWAEQA